MKSVPHRSTTAAAWMAHTFMVTLLGSVAACSQTGLQLAGGMPPAAGNARYFHQVDLSVSQIAVQMNMPNSDTCTLAVLNVKKTVREEFLKQTPRSASTHDLDGLLDRMYRCSAEDRSSSLPVRATLRNRSNGLLVDVYASTMENCNTTIAVPDSNIEAVATCSRYSK